MKRLSNSTQVPDLNGETKETNLKPTDTQKKHNAAGSLSKYANKSLVGKEEELYHLALDDKYKQ